MTATAATVHTAGTRSLFRVVGVPSLYRGLAEVEADTHLHVHKENNVLFPAVLELEAATTAPSSGARAMSGRSGDHARTSQRPT